METDPVALAVNELGHATEFANGRVGIKDGTAPLGHAPQRFVNVVCVKVNVNSGR